MLCGRRRFRWRQVRKEGGGALQEQNPGGFCFLRHKIFLAFGPAGSDS